MARVVQTHQVGEELEEFLHLQPRPRHGPWCPHRRLILPTGEWLRQIQAQTAGWQATWSCCSLAWLGEMRSGSCTSGGATAGRPVRSGLPAIGPFVRRGPPPEAQAGALERLEPPAESARRTRLGCARGRQPAGPWTTARHHGPSMGGPRDLRTMVAWLFLRTPDGLATAAGSTETAAPDPPCPIFP